MGGGLPDCGTHPVCGECRKTNHEECTGCIACGCVQSARFAHWISDPANRAS